MCIFPADSEGRVIQCAVELRSAFSQILAQRDVTHECELEVGIGAGKVEVGVFGEEVNRTAMIGHHRETGITENAYEKVRLTHKTRALPEVRVKWQKGLLRFWEVIV